MKINGTEIATPYEMSVTVADLDSDASKRNAEGTMRRDVLRGASTALRKVECKWHYLSDNEAKTLLQAISPASVNLQYDDPYTGALRTSKFYVGDRKCQVYRLNSKFSDKKWKEITASFSEY